MTSLRERLEAAAHSLNETARAERDCGDLEGASDTTRLKMLLRKAAALIGESEWRDIAEAPKDGTWILACWRPHNPMGVVQYKDGEWWESDEYVSEPTHWQPLPSPPEST